MFILKYLKKKTHLTSYIAKVFENVLPQRFLDKLYFLACMYTKAIAELDRGKSHKIQGFVLAENFALLVLIKSFSSANRGPYINSVLKNITTYQLIVKL